MGDSRRKRMLRATIPAELERRGLPEKHHKLMRWMRVDAQDHSIGLLPDDALAMRHYWRCNAGHIECARDETKGVLEHLSEKVVLP